MIYVYGTVCFLEAFTMAVGVNRSAILNVLASMLAFIVICLQLHGFSESFAVSSYILSFAHAAVIFVNGVITGLKRK